MTFVKITTLHCLNFCLFASIVDGNRLPPLIGLFVLGLYKIGRRKSDSFMADLPNAVCIPTIALNRRSKLMSFSFNNTCNYGERKILSSVAASILNKNLKILCSFIYFFNVVTNKSVCYRLRGERLLTRRNYFPTLMSIPYQSWRKHRGADEIYSKYWKAFD